MKDRRRRILEEIEKMIRLALKSDSIELADRYVEIAREISMKSRVRIPRDLKIFICKGCKKALIPGKTALFRVKKNHRTILIITCLRCNHVYRRVLGSDLKRCIN